MKPIIAEFGWNRSMVSAAVNHHKAAQDLKKMAALMRQPRTAADEPAGTYVIQTITRSL